MTVTVRYGRRMLNVEPVVDPEHDGICYLGRGGSGAATVWIRLKADDLTLSKRAVAVSCPVEGLWQIRRVSEKNGVEVRFPDGSRINVPSDRWRLMPSDEPLAYVVVDTIARSYEFEVRLGRHGEPFFGPDGGDDNETRTPIKPDPNLGYFKVCVALCESKLRDPFVESVPTEPEIQLWLARHGIEPDVTARAVQRRLDSVRSRLEVASNRELRDRLIASRAVTAQHLHVILGDG